MALFFTLLFINVAFLTPTEVFGELAQLRIEVILAVAAFVTSLPNAVRFRVLKSPQAVACVVLCILIPVSIAATGWFGGAIYAFYGFLTTALAFFLAAANFHSKRHLKLAVLALFLCSTYFIVRGSLDLYHQVVPSDYIYGDTTLRRIRGLGFVNDPNDFAQVMVSLIPLVFLWKSENRFKNIFLIGVPIAVLLTGMFLTHSRGSAVALMAVILISFRRKIGTVPAAVIAGGIFALSLAFGWSGGRDVSMEAGSDRLDAWAAGIQFIRQHPIFGVGSGGFAEYNGITAHNSIIVCAAELGLPGFICWILFVFSTIRSGIALQKGTVDIPDALSEPEVVPNRFVRMPQLAFMKNAMPLPVYGSEKEQAEYRRIGQLLLTSLTGFLVAGWFLSRAISAWLFFYCGMMFAVVRMAEGVGIHIKTDRFRFLLKWSTVIAAGLLLLVYVTLRARKLVGHE